MNDLIIRQKCEDMILYAKFALRQYPRHEKYNLSLDTKQAMYELLRLIITCNKKYYKKTTMQEIDVQLDILRSLIRIGMKCHYMDLKKYEMWSAMVDELGRMLGGWIRSVQK